MTTPDWIDLDKLCPPELQAQMADIDRELERLEQDIEPFLVKYETMLRSYETVVGPKIAVIDKMTSDDVEGAWQIVDTITGHWPLWHRASALGHHFLDVAESGPGILARVADHVDALPAGPIDDTTLRDVVLHAAMSEAAMSLMEQLATRLADKTGEPAQDIRRRIWSLYGEAKDGHE